MGSRIVTGEYVSGLNHSIHRPKLVEFLKTFPRTINIQLPKEVDYDILIPNLLVNGQDECDLSAGQDFFVRYCRLNGVEGFQILPVEKATNIPRGHHAFKKIEISLKRKINIRHGDHLEVELLDFED